MTRMPRRLALSRPPKASQFALDVLIWDALLGVAIGVLVVIAFALIFKSLQWLASG